MTNNDELAQKLKNQHIPAKYYLAECQECGELMPSNRLNVLTSPDGESECYCPHCQYGEINDLGIGDEPGALAWNFQQLRIEALLAERDADKKRIADLQRQREEETQRANRADFEGYSRAMRELEARTVNVKLPEPFTKSMYGTALYEHDDIVTMLSAAGIKLEVGE